MCWICRDWQWCVDCRDEKKGGGWSALLGRCRIGDSIREVVFLGDDLRVLLSDGSSFDRWISS